MRMNAVVDGKPLMDVFKEVMVTGQNNRHVLPKVSAKTVQKYTRKQAAYAVEGAIKTSARFSAVNNIRTPIALISTLDYVLKRVSPECFFSSDDTSVLVHEHEKPRVITTKLAQDYLAKHNLNVSTVEDVEQQRVITYSLTISGDNKLVCTVIKIVDKLFPEYSEKPFVAEVEPGLFVMLYGPSCLDVCVNLYMYQLCIIPSCEAERQRVCELNLRGLVQLNLSTDSQPLDGAVPPLMLSEEGVRQRYKYMCLASDGAYGQISAIQLYLEKRTIRKNQCIIWMKYGAGCSMVHSPNDAGAGHRIMKREFHSQSFKYDDVQEPRAQSWVQLQSKLKDRLKPASYRTYWKALCHSPVYLNKACSTGNLQSAFAVTGIFPFKPAHILSSCYHFTTLDDEQADHIVNNLPVFAALMERDGMVTEVDFDRVLGAVPGVDNYPPKVGMPLNDMVTNRQRALVISHPAYSVVAREILRRRVADGQPPEEPAQNLQNPAIGGDGPQPPTTKKRKVPCTNFECNVKHDLTAAGWVYCGLGAKKKKCKKLFCVAEQCGVALEKHKLTCNMK